MSWDYAVYEYYLSAALLVCAMFGMGTTLTVRDFADLIRAPSGILLTIAIQILLTPLIAIAVAHVFSVPAGIAVGMLLVAALPGGLFSNLLTYLGKGNVALSVSATAICTLACLLTTSAVLQTFGATQLPANFSMPLGRILSEISLCLMLPLVAGMLCRRLAPEHHSGLARFCIRASLVMLGVFILGAVTAGRIRVLEYGWRTPLALFLFCLLSLWLTYVVCCLLRLPLGSAFAIGIEVVVRNAHLGILLKASLFPASDASGSAVGDAVLFVLLFYGACSLLIAGSEVACRRNRFGLVFGWYAGRLETAEAAELPASDRRKSAA